MTTSRYHRRPRRLACLRSCTRFPHVRLLTVSTLWCNGKATPWIRLRGQWLQQAGFAPQSPIRVTVTRGCLVIEPLPD